ncbi:MAG: hypothetical protein H6901_09440 [Rhodobacteraceae bacterium]|nr:hypothetical protein [Paracoccaceae bacterium]MCP5342423.1 hypothetical protein [Paracoccaceae bacterium]
MNSRSAILIGSTLAAMLLTSCGTPQEQCIRAATRELRTVTGLIAETEATIARGYGYQSEEITRWAWVRCDFDRFDHDAIGPAPMCWEPYSDTIRRPVAIDPAVEARKLSALKSRQKILQTQANAQISDCRARFPEPK